MAEEKAKSIEKDQETTKPAGGKKEELSEKDLGKVSGGYKPENDDGPLGA